MIRLNSKSVSHSTQQHLNTCQNTVNSGVTFADKAKKAASLWDSKTSSQKGGKAFGEIKKALIEMCISVEICNYCENNEATDIEHIFPKKLFPEKAFSWDNYILACKTCNTTYKSDKFAVFHSDGSFFEIPQARGEYNQPTTDDAALINPRTENPLAFLTLDIIGKTFRFATVPDISLKDSQKATYTVTLLGLNNREALVEARRKAAIYYLDRLEKFVRIKNCQNFGGLQQVLHDLDSLDISKPFTEEKQRILYAIQKDILTYSHPTVWYELKRQKVKLPKTNQLFQEAPEALQW